MHELPQLEGLLSAEDFEPWIGQMFVAETDPEPVSIRLEGVERRPASPFAIRAPFNLVFRSPMDVLLVDGIYKLRCDRFGPHDIFLTPIVSPPGQRLYAAIFN